MESTQAIFDQALQVQSFEQWRTVARVLLMQKIPPHDVKWHEGNETVDLFSAAPGQTHPILTVGQQEPARVQSTNDAGAAAGSVAVQVPRKLMDMLQSASCYRTPARWAFLYRVIWRWSQGEAEVMSAADEDGNRLHAMVKAVHREEHDMHAYLRFRERSQAAGPPQFVAWYEPNHDVLPQVAQHFTKRMGGMTWMIATPDATVMWDGNELHVTGALLRGPQEIEDQGEALWLTYYRSIFNPARLNTRVMHSHIPARFWKNLPEGQMVPAMVAEAASGARQTGQAQAVGKRIGTVIPVSEERAQPKRLAPTTLDQCRRCDLWERATQAVGGSGSAQARIMVIGEQPGDQEDLAGQPFVGPAGQLLDSVFDEAGLVRQDVYLTNAVKHFKWEPKGKRRLHKTPGQREINACRYWLEDELAQVQPQVVIAMGSTALKSVMATSQVRLTEHLGKPFQHEGRWIVVIYHPAYVLRVPSEAARQDALRVMVDGFKQAQQLLADQGKR